MALFFGLPFGLLPFYFYSNNIDVRRFTWFATCWFVFELFLLLLLVICAIISAVTTVADSHRTYRIASLSFWVGLIVLLAFLVLTCSGVIPLQENVYRKFASTFGAESNAKDVRNQGLTDGWSSRTL